MRIADLDYYSIYGNSWLHRIPAGFKLIIAFAVLITVIFINNYIIVSLIYLVILSIVLFSDIPKFKILALSFYPLIFIAIYLFSIRNLSYGLLMLLIFRALSIATMFILLVFTTGYKEIFGQLDKFLPNILVSTLFLTYRSIFTLWKIFENLQLAMYIRGRPSFKKPLYSLKILGNALGYLLIRAIEMSEAMYDGMVIRGYSEDLRYLRK